MAETIGKKLRTTRESKGLSLNDVAFETRMHPSFVEALEMDDYSAFANTTYARSFLTLYCRFLNVDAGDAIEQFSGGRNVTWNSNGSLMVLQTVGGADSATRERFFARPEPVAMGNGRNAPRFPIGLGLMVFLLLALGLLAKPMLVTLPAVLLLLDYWPLHRLRARARRSRLAGSNHRPAPARSSNAR